MGKKNKDGVFSLLRQILAEQKKQTKILQAIRSSKEHASNISLEKERIIPSSNKKAKEMINLSKEILSKPSEQDC